VCVISVRVVHSVVHTEPVLSRVLRVVCVCVLSSVIMDKLS